MRELFKLKEIAINSMSPKMDNSHQINSGELNKLVTNIYNKVKILQERDLILQCLEEVGVDNWSGYSLAMELKEEYDSQTSED